jgi:hypothetical protein
MSDEEINVEEEFVEDEPESKPNGTEWTEEIKVASEELGETIKKLIHEAGVRRIIVKNNEKRTLLEIPLVLGLAGIALLPVYAALALSAALVTDCSILVERVEPETNSEA